MSFSCYLSYIACVKKLFLYFTIGCLALVACQGTGSSSDFSKPARANRHSKRTAPAPGASAPAEEANPRTESADGIDRNSTRLIYTKHARCRMGCRNIDESEVLEILKEGRINYRKSEPAARADPKYAFEGTTHDGQNVRIIFAPASRGIVVITVIDLGNEWQCDCK